MPDDLQPEERAIFEAFASVRARVAHAIDGFEDRVRTRIDRAEASRGPRLSDAVLAVLAEIMNRLSGLAGGDDE